MCAVMAYAPPGWLTTEDWAKRTTYSSTRCAAILKLAHAQGNAKRQTFRVIPEKYGKPVREYWWVNGVSEKIAKGGVKS